jgi:hypothetical protein
MPESHRESLPSSRGRMLAAAIFVVLVVIAVWWVIEVRQ